MKQTTKYILLVLIFIAIVVGITFSFLFIRYDEKGSVEVVKKYYDVMFINTMIEDNKKTSIKLNNNDDSIHISIPNLNEEKLTTFSVDAINIGNIDTYVDNYSISNVDTNANINDVQIEVSLNKDELIKGGESKKINVKVKYNGNSEEKIYYNFNINYVFNKDNV